MCGIDTVIGKQLVILAVKCKAAVVYSVADTTDYGTLIPLGVKITVDSVKAANDVCDTSLFIFNPEIDNGASEVDDSCRNYRTV